jgi:SAM-dependent methyltransferase
MALCRVPEIEFASTLRLDGAALDHCCGDGAFASLAWPDQRFHSGCDINEQSIEKAKRIGRYRHLDVCDAARKLPYPDGCFDLVFDNSALEHIPDLESALAEVARVTRTGGTFAFNILNDRFYTWWPLDRESLEGYKQCQPIYHILSIESWRELLGNAGFALTSVQGYFPEKTSRVLAELDCEFSRYFLSNRPSRLVDRYYQWRGVRQHWWRRWLENLVWEADPEEGAGYFIKAQRLTNPVPGFPPHSAPPAYVPD